MAHARGRRRTAAMVAAAVATALCALAPAAADAKGGGKDRDDLAVQAGAGERPVRGLALDDADLRDRGPAAAGDREEGAPAQAGLLLRLPDGQRPEDPGRDEGDRPRAAVHRALPDGAVLPALPGLRAGLPPDHPERHRARLERRRGHRRRCGPPPTTTCATPSAPTCARYNKGRPFVLIGHSQGSFVLRELVAKEVDPKASVRKRLLSAILLGGNVLVKKGSDRGGDFRHLRACRSAKQLHCIVAFSTFGDPPPANSAFGRPSRILGVGPKDLSKLEVLCTNPAALGGRLGPDHDDLPEHAVRARDDHRRGDPRGRVPGAEGEHGLDPGRRRLHGVVRLGQRRERAASSPRSAARRS